MGRILLTQDTTKLCVKIPFSLHSKMKGDPRRKSKLKTHHSEDMQEVSIDYITIVLPYP